MKRNTFPEFAASVSYLCALHIQDIKLWSAGWGPRGQKLLLFAAEHPGGMSDSKETLLETAEEVCAVEVVHTILWKAAECLCRGWELPFKVDRAKLGSTRSVLWGVCVPPLH